MGAQGTTSALETGSLGSVFCHKDLPPPSQTCPWPLPEFRFGLEGFGEDRKTILVANSKFRRSLGHSEVSWSTSGLLQPEAIDLSELGSLRRAGRTRHVRQRALTHEGSLLVILLELLFSLTGT